ncbi:DUF6338 family protein [Gluconobacter albidus]|nr:DUF6338 family protein [Gluconobacter albidus]
MPTTLAAFAVLIFLLPGFLTDRIIATLTPQKTRSDFRIVVDSLAWAFVDEVLYRILARATQLHCSPVHLPLFPLNIVPDHIEQVFDGHTLSTLFLILVSISMGLVWSGLSSQGYVFAFLRKYKATKSTGRIDVWQDVLQEYSGRWVRVHMKDGTRYVGWVAYFSEDPEKRELFLSDVLLETPVPDDENSSDPDDLGADNLLDENETPKEKSETAAGAGEAESLPLDSSVPLRYTEMSGEGILLTERAEITYIQILRD